MRSNRLLALVAGLSLALAPLLNSTATARSYGGFSSGGGFHYSSSSGMSSGYHPSGSSGMYGGYHPSGGMTASRQPVMSAPSPRVSGNFGTSPRPTVAPTPVPRASGNFNSGATAPSVATAAASRPALPPASSRDRMVNRQVSAAAYSNSKVGQADHARVMAATGGRTYTPSEINRSRVSYVHTYYHDRYIPSYAYSGSHGMWSDLFLYSMLYNSMFSYNHWNDPSYQAWYQQAQIQAQNDAQLRMQLAALQQQVAGLRANGTPVDPNYVPANTPPSVMYASSALTNAPAPVHKSHVLAWVLGILVFLGIGGLAIHFLRPARRNQLA